MVDDGNARGAHGLSSLLRTAMDADRQSLLVEVSGSDNRIYQLEIMPPLIGPLISTLIQGALELRANHRQEDRFQFHLGFAKNVEGEIALEVSIGQANLILPIQTSELHALSDQLAHAIDASDKSRHH